MDQPLYWDAVFEIALALIAKFPEEDLEEVSLLQIFEWTLALPNFKDDTELANDDILLSIYQEWYEEKNPI